MPVAGGLSMGGLSMDGMMMDGLTFTAATPTDTDPSRMDIACFVGFVARRPVRPRASAEDDASFLRRLPPWLLGWLDRRGWRPGQTGRSASDLVDLRDVPVPIDTWDAFDSLFAWNERPLDPSGRRCDTAMGAAVRRFFARGGRKCYVVRIGDPWMALASISERTAREADFLPMLPAPSPVDRETWRGVGHLLGLPDVSLLSLPDSPDFFSTPPSTLPRHVEHVPIERFVECAERTEPQEAGALRHIPPPGCDASGFRRWGLFIENVGSFLSRHAREVQFVAALPLPIDERAVVGLTAPERILRDARAAQLDAARRVHSRFVQLAYPWIRTTESSLLLGDLEAPDAALTGMLAGNALKRATWTSLIRTTIDGVLALEPVPDRALLHRPFSPPAFGGAAASDYDFMERVTVITPSPRGFRLASDVTTAGGRQHGLDADELYRPANVHRLLAAILRAARRIGEEAAFDNNGELLWRKLRDGLENFLAAIWADGALAGASAAEAYDVRCDRSTMTQTDLDAGRVIVRISFTAAVPIVHITVVLAMDEGGRVSLLSEDAATPAAAATA